MATATSDGAPAGHHRLAERLRAAVLGPRGGGTTRRRASDVFRLGFAVVVVAVSIPVMRANSAAELSIVRAVHPPPPAISWLVTVVFWLGSAGASVLLVVAGLLVPRLTAVRRAAVAALATWGVCILLAVLLGPAAGRPPVSELAGVDASYPVTALPYLSRPVHRTVWFLVAVAVLASVSGGTALPVNAISSVALGWGAAAALQLAVGSPLGLPSAAEVTGWIADLRVEVADITRAPRQVWGVEQFTGRDPAGRPVELLVYGRDASDAGVLAKLWRFCVYRDSGPTLIMDRLQQVEHEAYLTFMAGRAGVVPATASVGPGAGCHCRTSGIRSVEKPLSAIRRPWSRHAGRSVPSGATTPNRKLLAPPVASLAVIVAVLDSFRVDCACSCPPIDCRAGPDPLGISALIRSRSASTSRPVRWLRVHRPPAKPPVAGVQVSES